MKKKSTVESFGQQLRSVAPIYFDDGVETYGVVPFIGTGYQGGVVSSKQPEKPVCDQDRRLGQEEKSRGIEWVSQEKKGESKRTVGHGARKYKAKSEEKKQTNNRVTGRKEKVPWNPDKVNTSGPKIFVDFKQELILTIIKI
ncbi:hypothetical protein ElyMa_002068400 [Elysia marginata]|uniref:Uncharacterized protein n=1 Tax=Elysia marginata TaxID=1093978 RepID=A0AAV4FC50_9GAST|nr:hypothetical protein ElyMa_002068400 [Elysia marginata]